MLLLDALREELDKGKVYECALRSHEATHDGLCHGDVVYVDPRPAVLETLLHELLHRRFPALHEREVTRKARRLVKKMDEATKRKWWAAYNRVKRKRRPVDADDT